MIMQKLYIISSFLILSISSSGQTKGWTNDEKQYYSTMKALFEYFKNQSYDSSHRRLVFDKFVYLDNILKDTSTSRLNNRLNAFDTFFYKMLHFIDSVGLENLEARPTRYFKENKAFFAAYEKGRELNEALPLTLTYFDKRLPEEPIGTLLFEQKTHKLLAWIMLSQAGYQYFLTFNML